MLVFVQNETIHCGICDKNVMLYATPVKDKRRYCPYCGNFPLWPEKPALPDFQNTIHTLYSDKLPEVSLNWLKLNAPAHSD